MIVWGCVTGYLAERSEVLVRSIDEALAGDDIVILTRAATMAVGYNRILGCVPVGASVVLLHDDTELQAGARVAICEALESADVVGVVGGSEIPTIEWWRGKVKRGYVRQANGVVDFGPHGEVDAVDGLLLALAPSVTHLRFDESYPGFHGYDVDLCFQARAEGLTVATAPIPVIHQTNGGIRDMAEYRACNEVWERKWSA